MINLLSTKDKIKSPTDMISVPTSSSTLAKAIERFIGIDGNGLYNVVSNNEASSFDYINEIKKLTATPCIIEPTTYSDFQQFPLRPKYSVLGTKKYESLFQNDDDWKVTIHKDINKLIDLKLLETTNENIENKDF
jgi:dTDP-4-dehydrorhamnose reductase